jgi:hypothetical protein
MNGPAQYLHFGFILISLANLIVIALLIVVFMLAVALRRPEKQRLSTIEAVPEPEEAGDRDLQPAGFAMGSDERDRQLSWAGLALALHLLVPGTALQHFAECRCASAGHDGHPHSPARIVSLPALSQSPAILPRRSSPDLARVLS